MNRCASLETLGWVPESAAGHHFLNAHLRNSSKNTLSPEMTTSRSMTLSGVIQLSTHSLLHDSGCWDPLPCYHLFSHFLYLYFCLKASSQGFVPPSCLDHKLFDSKDQVLNFSIQHRMLYLDNQTIQQDEQLHIFLRQGLMCSKLASNLLRS